MRTFKAFHHPSLGAQAVKVGFCWPASFFGGGWLLVARLWRRAAIWWGLFLVIQFAGALLGLDDYWDQYLAKVLTGVIPAVESRYVVYELLILAAYLILFSLPGFSGNRWRELDLLARGYAPRGVARSREGALALAEGLRQGTARR